jgi:hypothetical protein
MIVYSILGARELRLLHLRDKNPQRCGIDPLVDDAEMTAAKIRIRTSGLRNWLSKSLSPLA